MARTPWHRAGRGAGMGDVRTADRGEGTPPEVATPQSESARTRGTWPSDAGIWAGWTQGLRRFISATVFPDGHRRSEGPITAISENRYAFVD